MKRYLYINYALPLLLTSMPCQAVFLGYITSEQYDYLDEFEKEMWVKGSIDGILAEAINNNLTFSKDLGKCISSYELKKLVLIFEKEKKKESGARIPAATHLRHVLISICNLDLK